MLSLGYVEVRSLASEKVKREVSQSIRRVCGRAKNLPDLLLHGHSVILGSLSESGVGFLVDSSHAYAGHNALLNHMIALESTAGNDRQTATLSRPRSLLLPFELSPQQNVAGVIAELAPEEVHAAAVFRILFDADAHPYFGFV